MARSCRTSRTNPISLSASAYIEQQQNAIRSLNTLLPVMGAICIALTVTLAVLSKGDPRSRYLVVGAAVNADGAGQPPLAAPSSVSSNRSPLPASAGP